MKNVGVPFTRTRPARTLPRRLPRRCPRAGGSSSRGSAGTRSRGHRLLTHLGDTEATRGTLYRHAMRVQATVTIDRPRAEIGPAVLEALGRPGPSAPGTELVVSERALDRLAMSGRDGDAQPTLRVTYVLADAAGGMPREAVDG